MEVVNVNMGGVQIDLDSRNEDDVIFGSLDKALLQKGGIYRGIPNKAKSTQDIVKDCGKDSIVVFWLEVAESQRAHILHLYNYLRRMKAQNPYIICILHANGFSPNMKELEPTDSVHVGEIFDFEYVKMSEFDKWVRSNISFRPIGEMLGDDWVDRMKSAVDSLYTENMRKLEEDGKLGEIQSPDVPYFILQRTIIEVYADIKGIPVDVQRR